MKILLKISSLICLLALSSTSFAELIGFQFEGDVEYVAEDGSLDQFIGGTYRGTFIYDNSLLPYLNEETLSATSGALLSITYTDNSGNEYFFNMDNGTIAVLNSYLATQLDGFVVTDYYSDIHIGTTKSSNLPLSTPVENINVHLHLLDEDVLSSTSLSQEIIPELFNLIRQVRLSYPVTEDENGFPAPNFAIGGVIDFIEEIEVEQPTSAISFTNSLNIGNYGEEGTFSYDQATGVYDLESGGANIGRWEDWFHFVYEEISGDVDVSARIQYISEGWSSAGIMIRDELTTYSKQASSLITLHEGGRFSVRQYEATPHPDIDVSTIAEGSWLRLVKQGNQVSNYVSGDGVTWTLIATDTVDFGETFYIGIAGVANGSGPATNIIVDEVKVEIQ